MVAARAKGMFEEEAKARQRQAAASTNAKLGRETSKTLPANLPEAKGEAREQAAALTNVSARSVESASKVLKQGTPELVRAVEAGEVAVSTAADVATLPLASSRLSLGRRLGLRGGLGGRVAFAIGAGAALGQVITVMT